MSNEAHCVGLELLNLDLTSLELANALNINPLHCLLCHQLLSDPCSLQCYHVFCRHCLTDRKKADIVFCPLCGVASPIPVSGELLVDRLLKFFVQSASERADACANCDETAQPMWFCETCQQPLCLRCKETTHNAKMFAAHKLVPLQERTGLGFNRKCEKHLEPFILFSLESRSLICINCIKNANLDVRSHFVNLDVAYETGCQKLEQVYKNLKAFQKDLENNILLHKSLYDEVRRNAQAETASVQQLCQQLVDKLLEIRDCLLQQIASECTEREEHFKGNLRTLTALMPTVQMYLLIASIFGSSASKMDFLDLGYNLMSRMTALIVDNQDRRPEFTSLIQSGFKVEFAKVLDSYLGIKSILVPNLQLQPSLSQERILNAPELTRTLSSDISPASSVNSYPYVRCKRGSSSKYLQNFASKSDLAGVFGESFASIEHSMKDLLKRFVILRKGAQELQRDLTLRRCLVSEERLLKLQSDTDAFKKDLEKHAVLLDEVAPVFHQLWEEQIDRVRMQQDLYQANVAQTARLQEDTQRITVIADKMNPFVRSITAAIQTITPLRCVQELPAPMEQICLHISTLEPNSQSRVDAIEREESHRKLMLEEQKQKELEVILRTKTKLKTPRDAARRKSGSDRSVLREVARERDLADAHQQILQSLSILEESPNSSFAMIEDGAADACALTLPNCTTSVTTPPAPVSVPVATTTLTAPKAFSASPACSPRSSVQDSVSCGSLSPSGGHLSSLDQSLDESLEDGTLFALSASSSNTGSRKGSAVSPRASLRNSVALSVSPKIEKRAHTVPMPLSAQTSAAFSQDLENRSTEESLTEALRISASSNISLFSSTSLPEISSSPKEILIGGKMPLEVCSSSIGVVKPKPVVPPPPLVPSHAEMLELLKSPAFQKQSAAFSASGATHQAALTSETLATVLKPHKLKTAQFPLGMKLEVATIEARERLMDDLKKKVPRVDIGPPSKHSSPDRILEDTTASVNYEP